MTMTKIPSEKTCCKYGCGPLKIWSSDGDEQWPWPRFLQERLARHMVMLIWKFFSNTHSYVTIQFLPFTACSKHIHRFAPITRIVATKRWLTCCTLSGFVSAARLTWCLQCKLCALFLDIPSAQKLLQSGQDKTINKWLPFLSLIQMNSSQKLVLSLILKLSGNSKDHYQDFPGGAREFNAMAEFWDPAAVRGV